MGLSFPALICRPFPAVAHEYLRLIFPSGSVPAADASMKNSQRVTGPGSHCCFRLFFSPCLGAGYSDLCRVCFQHGDCQVEIDPSRAVWL